MFPGEGSGVVCREKNGHTAGCEKESYAGAGLRILHMIPVGKTGGSLGRMKKHLKTVCRRMSKNKRSQNGTNPKHDIRGTQKPLAHTGYVAMHGQV
jgi:hypothetical protein